MQKKRIGMQIARLKKAQARRILKSIQADTFILTKPGVSTAQAVADIKTALKEWNY